MTRPSFPTRVQRYIPPGAARTPFSDLIAYVAYLAALAYLALWAAGVVE